MSPSDLPSQLQSGSQCPVAISGDLTKLLTDIGNPAQLTNLINTLKAALGSGATPDQLIAALQALGLGSLPGAGTTTAATTTTATTSSSGGLPLVDLPSDTTTASDTTTTTSDSTTTSSSSSSSSLPAPPDPSTDLMQLVTDFFTYCVPAPPSGGLPSTPTSSAAGGAPVGEQGQPDTQAVSTPEATQAAVSYPGYAGTGGTAALRPASDQRPSPAVPLAVLGGVLLVGSAATAAGVRSRARRHGR